MPGEMMIPTTFLGIKYRYEDGDGNDDRDRKI